ncbi:DNA helicase [Tanacetum coccineum]
MINQLHNISTILDSHTNPSNAYTHAPPSPPPQPIHPPSHAQMEKKKDTPHVPVSGPIDISIMRSSGSESLVINKSQLPQTLEKLITDGVKPFEEVRESIFWHPVEEFCNTAIEYRSSWRSEWQNGSRGEMVLGKTALPDVKKKRREEKVLIWLKLHDIPIMAFTKDGLSAMATKLGTSGMLDSYTSSMCLQSWGRLDYACALIDIRVDREFKEEMIIAIPDVEDNEEQPVSKKNDASSSGTKKQAETTRQEANTSIPFDTLNTVENDGDLGSNRGTSNLGKKVVNDVADSSNETKKVTETNKVGADLYATSIPNTSNVTLNKLDDPVNVDSDSEVKEVYNETASFMAQTGSKINKVAKNGSGVGNKRLYERWKETYDENPYADDDFDHCGFIETQMTLGLKHNCHLAWFQHFANYALWVGFSSSQYDSSYLSIRMHDISSFHKELDMTYLGALNYFLRIYDTRDFKDMFISHKKYVMELFDTTHIANRNPTRTPVDMESKMGSDGDPLSDPFLSYILHQLDPLLPILMLIGLADPLLGIILRVIVFSWRMIFSHGPSNGNTLSISNDDAGYKGVANAVAKIAWLRNASSNLKRRGQQAEVYRVIVFSWRMIFLHGPSNGKTLSISNDDAGYKVVANAVAKIAWLRNASSNNIFNSQDVSQAGSSFTTFSHAKVLKLVQVQYYLQLYVPPRTCKYTNFKCISVDIAFEDDYGPAVTASRPWGRALRLCTLFSYLSLVATSNWLEKCFKLHAKVSVTSELCFGLPAVKRKISSEDDIEGHSFSVPKKPNVGNLTAIDVVPNVSRGHEPSPDVGQSSVAVIHSHDSDHCPVYDIKTKNKAVKRKISFEDDIEGQSSVAVVHSHESDYCQTNARLKKYQHQPPLASDSRTTSNGVNIMVTRNAQHRTRRYDLPTLDTIGAIVFGGTSITESEFDIIVEEHSRVPQQNRLDYILQNQNDIRNEYLSGLYDAIMRGDRDANDLGTRTILTTSFTGGPRYMYAHYLDALAICRVHGNPSFFITFTCNTKWPEIEEYMEAFPELTTADRADIVDRVFEQKVLLYTIEFQKRGLPHCHSLLWVTPACKVQTDADIDKYISAELPNPTEVPHGYRIISELMMHGPCGLVNKNAACMKDGNKFVHYRRRETVIDTTTNRAACEALGLIGGDQEWVSALEEAVVHASSEELVQILIFCDVSLSVTGVPLKWLLGLFTSHPQAPRQVCAVNW